LLIGIIHRNTLSQQKYVAQFTTDALPHNIVNGYVFNGFTLDSAD